MESEWLQLHRDLVNGSRLRATIQRTRTVLLLLVEEELFLTLASRGSLDRCNTNRGCTLTFSRREECFPLLDVSNLLSHRWFVGRNPTVRLRPVSLSRPRCWNSREDTTNDVSRRSNVTKVYPVLFSGMLSWYDISKAEKAYSARGFAVFTHPLFLADHVGVARIANGNADQTGCGKRMGLFRFAIQWVAAFPLIYDRKGLTL